MVFHSEKTIADHFQVFSDDFTDPTRVGNIYSKDKYLFCTYSSRHEAQTILTSILLVFSLLFVVTNFDTIFDTNEGGNMIYIWRQGLIPIFCLDRSDKNWEAMPHCLVTKLMSIIIHLSLHLSLHLHLEYCELKIKLKN